MQLGLLSNLRFTNLAGLACIADLAKIVAFKRYEFFDILT